MMKNKMGLFTQNPHPNAALREIEHLGASPIHQAHVQKAFQVKMPQVGIQMPKPTDMASPWLHMGIKQK